MYRATKRGHLILIAEALVGISGLLFFNRVAETFNRTGCFHPYMGESLMFTISQLFIFICVICGVKSLLATFARIRWSHFTRYKMFFFLCVAAILLRNIWRQALTLRLLSNGIPVYLELDQPVFFHRSMVIFIQISVICPLLFILSAKACSTWKKWYSMLIFTAFCVIWAFLYAQNDLSPDLTGKQDMVWNMISDGVLYIIYISCGYYYFYKPKVIEKKGFWGLIIATSIGGMVYEAIMMYNGEIRYIPDFVGDYYSVIYVFKKKIVLMIPIYIILIIFVLWVLIDLYRSITVASGRIVAIGPLVIIIIRWVLSLCCALFLPFSNVFLALPFYGPQAFYEMMLIAVIIGCCFIPKEETPFISENQPDDKE